jgi:hypothetical protein
MMQQAPADAVPAFREFVSNEKQRLTQKRQALVKNEMDKRMAELVKFSQSFKVSKIPVMHSYKVLTSHPQLNKPIPDDLVAILAKDEDKQKAIREKAEKDAASAQARAIGASTPSIASRGVLAGAKPAGKPNAPLAPSKTVTGNLSQTSSSSAVPKAGNSNAAGSSSSAAPAAATKSNESVLASKKVSMVIQAIPPFRGSKPTKPAAPPAALQAASNGVYIDLFIGGSYHLPDCRIDSHVTCCLGCSRQPPQRECAIVQGQGTRPCLYHFTRLMANVFIARRAKHSRICFAQAQALGTCHPQPLLWLTPHQEEPSGQHQG